MQLFPNRTLSHVISYTNKHYEYEKCIVLPYSELFLRGFNFRDVVKRYN